MRKGENYPPWDWVLLCRKRRETLPTGRSHQRAGELLECSSLVVQDLSSVNPRLGATAGDLRMPSAHETKTCQETTPMPWVSDAVGETAHLQTEKYWWAAHAGWRDEGCGNWHKEEQVLWEEGIGKGIPGKEEVFHLKVCHIHYYLRWKKSLKKAPLLNKLATCVSQKDNLYFC